MRHTLGSFGYDMFHLVGFRFYFKMYMGGFWGDQDCWVQLLRGATHQFDIVDLHHSLEGMVLNATAGLDGIH